MGLCFCVTWPPASVSAQLLSLPFQTQTSWLPRPGWSPRRLCRPRGCPVCEPSAVSGDEANSSALPVCRLPGAGASRAGPARPRGGGQVCVSGQAGWAATPDVTRCHRAQAPPWLGYVCWPALLMRLGPLFPLWMCFWKTYSFRWKNSLCFLGWWFEIKQILVTQLQRAVKEPQSTLTAVLFVIL